MAVNDGGATSAALGEIRDMAMAKTRQPNDAWSTVYHLAQDALDHLDPHVCDDCGRPSSEPHDMTVEH